MPNRQFHTDFWINPFVEKLTPLQRLLLIYCGYNSHCSSSGLYYITPKRISFESGIPEDQVVELFPSLSPRIEYDFSCNLVFVRDFLREQIRNKSFIISVVRSLKQISPHPFLNEFLKENGTLITACGHSIDNLWTDVISPSLSPSPSLSGKEGGLGGENEDKSTTSVKEKHLDYIWLTADEFRLLTEKLGRSVASRLIGNLNNYAHQIGETKFKDKYKSHYHVILNWYSKDNDGRGSTRSIRPSAKNRGRDQGRPGKYSGIGKTLPAE